MGVRVRVRVSNMDIFWKNTLDVIKCSDWLKHALKLFYKSNRPHFLWVYQHDNPLGMLEEHEKSL